mgnify:FL=1|uniref:Uncharacterized protein n=1 Tax=viral metagenome TaxID=1070528 RepID=A0A6C0BXB6_9ZZZZ
MKNLTLSDYKAILYYYNVEVDTLSKKQIKLQAEDMLAAKLCRCIKKVNAIQKDNSRSIAICRNRVIKRKGLATSGFKCKRKPRLLPFKKTKRVLKKLRKNLTIRKYKK